jgi:hypothetical protein
MKAAVRKKSSARTKSAAKRSVRNARAGEAAAPRVISRKYLSPAGVREISSRRLTAAIKAVKEAHASHDDVEM